MGEIEVSPKMRDAAGMVVLVLMLSLSGTAAAATTYFKIGADLKDSCDATAAGEPNASTAEYLLCLGYLQGVADTDATLAEWSDSPRQACVPQGITSSQLRRVFLDWIGERPDHLHFSAASLALTAFSESWPCKKN